MQVSYTYSELNCTICDQSRILTLWIYKVVANIDLRLRSKLLTIVTNIHILDST